MLEQMKSVESSLVEVIRSAAQALDGLGTSAVESALGELLAARDRADERLKRAAEGVRNILAGFTADASNTVAKLAEDLAAPKTTCATVAEVPTPAPFEVAQTQDEGATEATSATVAEVPVSTSQDCEVETPADPVARIPATPPVSLPPDRSDTLSVALEPSASSHPPHSTPNGNGRSPRRKRG